jgi:hypothetical protein
MNNIFTLINTLSMAELYSLQRGVLAEIRRRRAVILELPPTNAVRRKSSSAAPAGARAKKARTLPPVSPRRRAA